MENLMRIYGSTYLCTSLKIYRNLEVEIIVEK